MEKNIGGIIEYDGQKVKIEKGLCDDCYFENMSSTFCKELKKVIGPCEVDGGEFYLPIDICYKLIKEE